MKLFDWMFVSSLLLIYLYRLSDFLPINEVIVFLTSFGFIFATTVYLSVNTKYSIKTLSSPDYLILVILLIIYLIGAVRYSSDTFLFNLKLISVIILTVIFVQSYISYSIKDANILSCERFIKYLLLIPVIYVSINVILHLLGISPSIDPNRGGGLILRLLGIEGLKITMPLSSGPNSFGVLAGLSFMISIMLIFSKRNRNNIKIFKIILYVILMILSVYGVILSDTRLSIILSIFVPILFAIVKRLRFKKILYFVPLLIPLLPLITVSLLSFLVNFQFLNEFSRNSEDFKTLNGRTYIWNSSLEHFSDPNIIHIFGYGGAGQYISGASEQWAYKMGSAADGAKTTSHNMFIQNMYDVGYIGVIIIIIAILVIMKNLRFLYSRKYYSVDILTATVIYLILNGLTESVVTLSNEETLIYTIMIYIVTLNLRYKID